MSFVNKNLRNSGPWKPTYDHKNNLNTQNAFLKEVFENLTLVKFLMKIHPLVLRWRISDKFSLTSVFDRTKPPQYFKLWQSFNKKLIVNKPSWRRQDLEVWVQSAVHLHELWWRPGVIMVKNVTKVDWSVSSLDRDTSKLSFERQKTRVITTTKQKKGSAQKTTTNEISVKNWWSACGVGKASDPIAIGLSFHVLGWESCLKFSDSITESKQNKKRSRITFHYFLNYVHFVHTERTTVKIHRSSNQRHER